MSCNVKQIDHVTFVVTDIEASRRFYVDVLGMEEVARPAFNFIGLWFQAGATLVHVIQEHPASGPAGNLIPPGTTVGRTRHIAFEVQDVFESAEVLKQLGVEIVSGPKERPDGAVQLCILDPDQHVIELFHPPRGT